jgi:hypothetical protein
MPNFAMGIFLFLYITAARKKSVNRGCNSIWIRVILKLQT